MIAYTVNHTMLTLKDPPLSSGGEGTVYEIQGYPKRVAKIYHDPADAKTREEKISAMVNISNDYTFRNANLSQDIAWPLSPLYDSTHNFIGFGMARISATTELDDLYVYPSKNQTVNMKEKVKILISLCDVIDRLHGTGQVFGDFNPNNIKVKSDSTVSFVDADSYHVRSGIQEYRCVVCAPGYVAPEVIKACKGGITYADCPGSTFTKNTDHFALAIHVFRMLMNGCHPFICERYVVHGGSTPAPKPMDKRVESGETPFFKTIPNYTTPHYAPDIKAFPSYIRDLFKQAFVDGHTNPNSRPNAMTWKTALARFEGELVKCNHGNNGHYYWKDYHTCPYCEADARHNQKIRVALPPVGQFTAPSTTQGNSVPTNTANNSTSSATQKATPMPTIPVVPASKKWWFWLLTIALSMTGVHALGTYVLPEIYWSIYGEEMLVYIGVIGSMISGIVGTFLYNIKWTRGKTLGCHDWKDYILSVLTSLGFVIGFGVAMFLIALLICLLCYIFLGALIVGIIVGIFSGG